MLRILEGQLSWTQVSLIQWITILPLAMQISLGSAQNVFVSAEEVPAADMVGD